MAFSGSMALIMMRCFAPAGHMTTVRALLVVASIRHRSTSRLDVKNVFLNGELCEEAYVQPPLGYSTSRFSYACF